MLMEPKRLPCQSFKPIAKDRNAGVFADRDPEPGI